MNLNHLNEKTRIAIGSAQFGMDYGIAGGGKVSEKEIFKILDYAKEEKINTIDTAIGYGESEKVLGKMDISRWKIITKIPPIPMNCKDLVQWVIESTSHSLKRLKISRLYGLLLHRPEDLMGSAGQQLYNALLKCRDMDLVQKIGISIYNPFDLEKIINKYSIDLIQAPLNVIDRRLVTKISPKKGCWLDILHEYGIETHVRSIFLQGLLLMKQNQRPEKFSRWSESWVEWHKWLEENNYTATEVCLKFALNYTKIDRVVVGVSNLSELKQLLTLSKKEIVNFPTFKNSIDQNLINPSNWDKVL